MDADRRAALEWHQYSRSKCSGCGHPRSESMNPQFESDWEVEAWKCHACAARQRFEESWTAESRLGRAATAGIQFHAQRTHNNNNDDNNDDDNDDVEL